MITIRTSTPLSDAIWACRQRQQHWANLTVQRRLRPIRALRHLLVQKCDDLAAALAHDIDKPADEVLAGEVLPLAEACRFLQSEAARLLRPRPVPARHRPLWLWGQSDTVYRRPRGLIGIIGTWNYPLLLNGVQLVQALAAGNGVLWKPSELAPATATVLAALLEQAGFPADLVQLLPATREGGAELADADIDHIVFTGSSATGRRLAEHLGRRLVTSTLELSGCDALFVLEDADVALAARAAWFGATLNRGQTCLAVRRAFVQRSVYPAFVEALRPLASTAAPMSLVLESQVRQLERMVNEAVTEGAQLLDCCRPTQPNGTVTHCPPAVVLDARPEMGLCQEASFAPLLAVLPFETLEDAWRMNASCRYGLGASIFTRNPARAARFATRLRVGTVAINDVIVPTAHPATPFGGRGTSGWGITQGAEGLLEMTVPQVVSERGGSFRPHYDSAIGKPIVPKEALHGLLQWSHGASWREQVAGLLRLGRSLWHQA
jgi:acyl-CoA reductase-like NAD-dependent aldehyde dehydrogenase